VQVLRFLLTAVTGVMELMVVEEEEEEQLVFSLVPVVKVETV
jgi:hypothetical protein